MYEKIIKEIAGIISQWEKAEAITIRQLWRNEAGWLGDWWQHSEKAITPHRGDETHPRIQNLVADLNDLLKRHENALTIQHLTQVRPGRFTVWYSGNGFRGVNVCETCDTKGCHRPATWEIECRGAGVVSCLIYSCDDHCPDPAILSPQDEIRRLVEE